MKGGLTISGGEPLVQDRFALQLFGAAQAMGVHTALDTNGFLGDRLRDEDLEHDRSRHARPQGVGPARSTSGSPAWTSSPALASPAPRGPMRQPVWVRFVLVPG